MGLGSGLISIATSMTLRGRKKNVDAASAVIDDLSMKNLTEEVQLNDTVRDHHVTATAARPMLLPQRQCCRSRAARLHAHAVRMLHKIHAVHAAQDADTLSALCMADEALLEVLAAKWDVSLDFEPRSGRITLRGEATVEAQREIRQLLKNERTTCGDRARFAGHTTP